MRLLKLTFLSQEGGNASATFMQLHDTHASLLPCVFTKIILVQKGLIVRWMKWAGQNHHERALGTHTPCPSDTHCLWEVLAF